MMIKIFKLSAALIMFTLFLFAFSKLSGIPKIRHIKVCIDPGHGGKPEFGDRNGGDHWNPERKTFLKYYNFGADYKGFTEHSYVMEVAEKMKKELEKLNTPDNYKKMCDRLAHAGILIDREHDIRFEVMLTREESYGKRPEKDHSNINRFYRLFDSPHPVSGGELFPGRLSRINRFRPDVTVSFHVNYVKSQAYSGMLSFFAPSYNEMKEIYASKDHPDKLKDHRLFDSWNIRSSRINMEDWMINDAGTYFHGYKIDGRFIGQRNTMIEWRYDEPVEGLDSDVSPDLLDSSFWDRERSVYESYRRENGPEGFGGDNPFLSEEMLRYVSHIMKSETGSEVRIERPRACDWSLPIYNNSVTAGIELGNVYSDHDRDLMLSHRDEISESFSLALLCVLKGSELIEDNHENIRGEKLDLDKYGDYFER
ncbi:MAG: N-acetylmuramoyl-L-alanine amidase [Candidatus Muiribacteriaceae bacterium]